VHRRGDVPLQRESAAVARLTGILLATPAPHLPPLERIEALDPLVVDELASLA